MEVDGERRKVKLSRSSRMQVEEESMEVGLIKEDAIFSSRWIVGVNQIDS